MKILKRIIVSLVLSGLFASCMGIHQTVGNGPHLGTGETRRQVYLLWGLLPIGEVDSQKLARGSKDYAVYTRINIIDWIIGVPGFFLTVKTQTVTVER